MKFLWTTIYVKNLDESIAFYSEMVGLKVARRFPAGPGMEIAFMGNGDDSETLIELLENKNSGEISHSDFISVGFAVDSVDAMLETVKSKGITVCAGPVETPMMRYFCIKDPNGLTIQYFQQK